jgi:hypothetical protein
LDVREERSGETASHGAKDEDAPRAFGQVGTAATVAGVSRRLAISEEKMEFVALRWVIKLGATDDALKLRTRVSSAAWSVIGLASPSVGDVRPWQQPCPSMQQSACSSNELAPHVSTANRLESDERPSQVAQLVSPPIDDTGRARA